MASFVQVIAWAFLVAFIRVAGYSAVAEKVHLSSYKNYHLSQYSLDSLGLPKDLWSVSLCLLYPGLEGSEDCQAGTHHCQCPGIFVI